MAEAIADAFGSGAYGRSSRRFRLGDVRHVFASPDVARELGFRAEVPSPTACGSSRTIHCVRPYPWTTAVAQPWARATRDDDPCRDIARYSMSGSSGGPLMMPESERRADDGRRTSLVSTHGAVLAVPVERWFGEPSPADPRTLRLAVGPVLDIGCGPGATCSRSRRPTCRSLVSTSPTHSCGGPRRDGASVIRRSVFDDVPGAGEWMTCLLLDGNIGIGDDPVALLRRTREVYAPAVAYSLRQSRPAASPRRDDVHVQLDARRGPRFAWGSVSIDRLRTVAAAVGMPVVRCWSADGRWFAWLDRDGVVSARDESACHGPDRASNV